MTGGACFLSSHLRERLLTQGCEVVYGDNFFAGTQCNVEHMLGCRQFELLRHNGVTTKPNVETDQIHNLACPTTSIHHHLMRSRR